MNKLDFAAGELPDATPPDGRALRGAPRRSAGGLMSALDHLRTFLAGLQHRIMRARVAGIYVAPNSRGLIGA